MIAEPSTDSLLFSLAKVSIIASAAVCPFCLPSACRSAPVIAVSAKGFRPAMAALAYRYVTERSRIGTALSSRRLRKALLALTSFGPYIRRHAVAYLPGAFSAQSAGGFFIVP